MIYSTLRADNSFDCYPSRSGKRLSRTARKINRIQLRLLSPINVCTFHQFNQYVDNFGLVVEVDISNIAKLEIK